MPAYFSILETLLKRAFWYRQQLLYRFFFYLLNRSKTLSFLFPLIGVFSFGKRKSSAAMSSPSSDLFEQIWIIVERRNTPWAMSMRRCFCSKFSNFGTIFAAARFMPKTSVKITWHEPNNMPPSAAVSLIVILHWLSSLLQCFHRLQTCSGDHDEYHHWHLLGFP